MLSKGIWIFGGTKAYALDLGLFAEQRPLYTDPLLGVRLRSILGRAKKLIQIDLFLILYRRLQF